MLQSLSVNNYILIDKLTINLNPGFSTITGETGSGKSIILGALGLILGNRQQGSATLNEQKKCIIEAEFNIKDYDLKSMFDSNDLDYENICIIRREINSAGRSRAFINDTPVNLNVLQLISLRLIDIHSQNQNLKLSTPQFIYNLIDSFAQNKREVNSYQKEFEKLKDLSKELDFVLEEEKKLKQELDFVQFQWNEMEQVNLDTEKYLLLQEEINLLKNADQLIESLSRAKQITSEDENSISNLLNTLNFELTKISDVSKGLDEINKRTESVLIELDDISREIEIELDQVQINPEKQLELQEKNDLYNNLFLKHRVNNIEDLIDIKAELEQKLQNNNSIESKIDSLKIEINELTKSLEKKAKAFYEVRRKASIEVQKSVNNLLPQLSMENAEFKINLELSDELNFYGKDSISFLMKSNKGQDFSALNHSASGGELSRLAFLLKFVASKKTSMPTILFDEIDTGISGEVARQMGNLMQKMGKQTQLISITHLPQIASRGENHFKVYKETNKKNTNTYIKSLNEEERILELAEMLSGKPPKEVAIENAKSLLNE